MSLAAGTRLGPYEVTARIGAGGMGEVYRATDTALKRQVAIKVLPEKMAADSERLARFQREAELLASLNHPNIAHVHGLERSGTTTGLVMELVDGPTLADRIAQGPLPVDEALSIVRQVTLALEAAHDRGVVHRDLKPANIKVRPDGVVKVLDFGLAKAVGPDGSSATPDIDNSPTVTAHATEPGIILGTAAYMAPEQARGRRVDKRADIWALGCILFEMLTGRRSFEAPDVAGTLAAVLTQPPDWTRLPPALPRSIHRLLRGCLERDRSKRIADVAAVLFALDEATDDASGVVAPPAAQGRTRMALAGWIVALAVVAAWAVSSRQSPVAPTASLSLALPHAAAVISSRSAVAVALSPDASSLVFGSGTSDMRLRHLASGEDRVLSGTAAGRLPFWSPDGTSIGFFTDEFLKRLDLDTGFVRTLAVLSDLPRSGSWNRTGTVLFGVATGPLLKVSAEGGATPQPATSLLAGQSSHRFPMFLPDGRRFLFLSLGAPDVRGLYLGSLDSTATFRLTADASAFSFLPPDHLLIVRQGALWAHRLDAKSGALAGDPLAVASRAWADSQWTGLTALSAAPGAIVFRPSAEIRQLVWVDLAGKEIGILGELDETEVIPLAFSSDGSTVALRRTVNGNPDVWTRDTSRGDLRRISTSPAVDSSALLSRDASRIIYSSDPGGTLWDLVERSTDGSGAETVVLATAQNDTVDDWSPDEQVLLIAIDGPKRGDLYALGLKDRKVFPVTQTPAEEAWANFSPSGRWIAFESNETGRVEIHAQPFPGPGRRVQISRNGGREVAWPRHGSELFYTDFDGRVMAVPVAERGVTLDVGAARHLFTPQPGDLYQPAPDGRRFLVSRIRSPGPPLSVILNWKAPQRRVRD